MNTNIQLTSSDSGYINGDKNDKINNYPGHVAQRSNSVASSIVFRNGGRNS